MSPGLIVFIIVVVVVVGWFAIGTQYNIRRGNHALRWLQDGLPLVGEKTTLRWLGSSVVLLKVEKAKGPFRDAEILVVLEPRDVPLLWWLARIRGRRDLLIVRSRLRATPRLELEALDRAAWSTRGIERQVLRDNWTPLTTGSSLAAYAAGSLPVASELLELAALPECPLVRLAVRRTGSSLEMQWRLADVQKLSAHTVFQNLRRIAERL